MKVHKNKCRQKPPRKARGAIYTVCFVGLVIPFVLALGNCILQAALCYYDQDRLHFVGNDVIEHFESLADLDENKFDQLFSALAKANNLPVQSIKSQISTCPEAAEETVQIKVSGWFAMAPGMFSWSRPFVQIYKIKCSQFDTFGYLAINSYPYCEVDPTHPLSTYLPLYRPSPSSPTWQFCQDTAIGGVRKSICNTNSGDDQKPANWKQLADNLVSIY
jgi:hypothetical protein